MHSITSFGGVVNDGLGATVHDYAVLMDGGTVTTPRLAMFSPDNEWEVEMNPRPGIEGRDPQLENAAEIVLAGGAANPPREVWRSAPAKRV